MNINCRSSAPIVLGLTLVAATLTGCGGKENSASDQVSKDSVTIMTPKATGEVDSVKWGMLGSEPTTLDPIKVGTVPQNTVTSNLCESLMQVQPDFSLKPGLAESYDDVDATTIVFKVRDGVTFWNGDPLTADDVAFSLNRNLDPTSGALNGFLYGQVKSIEATGPLEVTVKFKEPDANFLSAVAGLSGAVSEKTAVEAAGKKYGSPQGGLMCTGPYQLGDWQAGHGIDIEANPSYWNRDLAPKTKKVHFDAIADDNTLTTALRSGALDGAYEVPPAAIPSLSKASNGKLYLGQSTEYFLFGPVDGAGPAGDVRVRKALELAFDREAFVKNILKGAGAPLKTFIPPFAISGNPAAGILTKGYDELDSPEHPDLDAAKKLVEEAQLKDNSMNLAITAGDQVALAAATLMQAAGKEIGLNITIKQMQDTQIFDLFFNADARKGIDLLATSGYYESPVFLSYTGAFVNPGGLVNFIGYDDPQATEKLHEALTALDPDKSATAYVEGQKIWHDARLAIPVSVQYERLFMREGLTGAPASQAYVSYPWATLLGSN